jgi:hypothetical protein
MTTKLFEVQEFNLCGGWSNNWTDENGPSYFESREAAQKELDCFLMECDAEVASGNMQDAPEYDDFRIIEVQNV